MSNTKFAGSALVLAAVLMGAGAYAQDAGLLPAGKMGMFTEMDADKDGKVTKAEVEALRAARFAEADANKDGKLSGEELTAAHEAMQAKRKAARQAEMVKRMDKDGDGFIQATEMPGAGMGDKMFEKLDSDADGAISTEEMQAAHEKMGKRGHGKGDHGKGGHGKGGHGKGGHGDRDGKGHGGFWGMFGDDSAEDAPAN